MSDDAYDLGAEQSLLGSVLTGSTVAADALLAVPASSWWHPRHGEIAAVITGMLRRNEPVDPQLVLQSLLARQGFGSDTGPMLITLMQRAWSPSNAPEYGDRIMRCASRRKVSAAATHLRQRLEESWVNGYDEPITDFTREMAEAMAAAERDAAGLGAEEPSQTVNELLATVEDHDWLVPDLLERGERIVITGTEGLGKSWLISQFGLTLAAGLHPFTGFRLGRDHPGYRVLVVDCENGLAQSRRRFRNMVNRVEFGVAVPTGWRDNLRIELRPNGLDLLGHDASWLESRVAANAPDLLIIGPLYRLHYANMNDELPARELVRVLDNIRTRHGCALLTEAHPGHAEDSAKERRMRPAGSSLFLRWPEFGYGLRRAKDQTDEHPKLVDVVPWRGSREERLWPKQLRHSDGTLPWAPASDEYWQEAA